MQSKEMLQFHQSQVLNTGMTSWSDESLISWISNKNSDWNSAFALLVTRYHPWVFRRCLFRLGNHHDAEDATHDIVLRVHANLHQLQELSKFKVWLNTIINNYCNTFALRRTRYISDDTIEQRIDLLDQEFMIDPYAVFAEDQMVRHALSMLPEKVRQVLSLRFYAEYSLVEIARALQLTLSAAKARLYRAIEQLKIIYEKLDNGKLPISSQV